MCSAESMWGIEISYTFLYSCSISALKDSSLLTWLLHPPCSKKRPRSSFGSNFPPVHLQGSVGNTNCQDHKYTPSYPAQGAAPSGSQHTPHHPLPRLFRPVKRYRHVPLSSKWGGFAFLCCGYTFTQHFAHTNSQPTSTDGAWFTLGLWSLTAAGFGSGPQHQEITAGSCIVQ